MTDWLRLDDIKDMSKDSEIRIAYDEIYTIAVDNVETKDIDDWMKAESLVESYKDSCDYKNNIEQKEFVIAKFVREHSDMSRADVMTSVYSIVNEGIRDKFMNQVQDEHYSTKRMITN